MNPLTRRAINARKEKATNYFIAAVCGIILGIMLGLAV